MIIGIYKSGGFSDRWISYCERNNISYKLVDVYANDIISQLSDCDVFMWHFSHRDYKDVQFAKSLLISLENSGKKVFPNISTCWHFDDKISQKYLLEAIGAPIVPTYVFYTKKEAIAWINKISFPKVFKLKGGAGASNVQLVKTKKVALKLINKCFGRGFSQIRFFDEIKEFYGKKGLSLDFIKVVLYMLLGKDVRDFVRYRGNEKGYVYFQEFIPNNEYDIRVCVIGNKAFALKRNNRENDFRASGSGNIIYDKSQIDERCVDISFSVNRFLKMQSVAFDFVFDEQGEPLIVEVSYGYMAKAYDSCEGYWTSDLKWHPGSNFDFCGWMVEDLLKK